jgi:hypothetical protein
MTAATPTFRAPKNRTSEGVDRRREDDQEVAMSGSGFVTSSAGPYARCATVQEMKEKIDQQAIDLGAVAIDLVILRGTRGGADSVAPPAYLFCSFAGCVSSFPSHFLLGGQQRLTFSLFGRQERRDFLCFALGLQGEFSSAGSLFS